MKTRNAMKFMAPDGDTAAVAEPPMPPIGNTYREALAKMQAAAVEKPDADPGAPPPTEPAKSAPTEPTKPAKAVETAPEPSKPASALDAVLDGAPPAEPTAPEIEPTPADDFLKELPETLPREGRGAHWEKARKAIATLGATVAERSKAVATLEAQIAKAQASTTISPEREAELLKQLDEYKDAMVGINVELHPDFIKEFVDGRKALVNRAASKLDAFGGEGKAIVAALEMPEGRARSQAIKEALESLEPVEQNRVLQFIGEVEKLDDKRAEIKTDPQGAWAKLQASEAARQKEAVTKAEEYKQSVFESVSKTLPSKYFLLRPVDPSVPGASEHNASIEEIRGGALALLGPEAKPADLVEAAYAKQLLPRVQKHLVEKVAELKTALAALKEFDGATPGFKGGKPKAKTPTEAKLEKTPGQLYQDALDTLKDRD